MRARFEQLVCCNALPVTSKVLDHLKKEISKFSPNFSKFQPGLPDARKEVTILVPPGARSPQLKFSQLALDGSCARLQVYGKSESECDAKCTTIKLPYRIICQFLGKLHKGHVQRRNCNNQFSLIRSPYGSALSLHFSV